MDLMAARATYDPETGTVTLTWENTYPPDEPDPVNWQATHLITLELSGATDEPIAARALTQSDETAEG